MTHTTSKSSPARGAVDEAELIAKVLDNAESVRIAGLTDPQIIKEYFGDKHVPYQYKVAGVILEGVIVSKKLADQYHQRTA